jgi:hypothetical protein
VRGWRGIDGLQALEVLLGCLVVGFEGEGALEVAAGGGAVAGVNLDDAEVVPVAGGTGVELDDDGLFGEGVGNAGELQIDLGKGAVGLGVARGEALPGVEVVEGLGKLALVGVDEGQGTLGVGIFVNVEGMGEELLGLVQIALLEVDLAEGGEGVAVVGGAEEKLLELELGGGGIALGEEGAGKAEAGAGVAGVVGEDAAEEELGLREGAAAEVERDRRRRRGWRDRG